MLPYQLPITLISSTQPTPGVAEKRLVYRYFVRADAGTRTPDPFITSEVLYQLSYVGQLPMSQSNGDL